VLFSRQWGDKQDDGSSFVDADADLFKHILRYLRRGVLPVFYDIERLEKWLSEKKYMEAIETDNSQELPIEIRIEEC
jgi:hypothetical protein